MRKKIPNELRRGRVMRGAYGTSEEFGLTGAFFVTCPATGRVLKILASQGEDWKEAGLPGEPWEHVSVSLADRPKHCPSWPEMLWVKDLFWETDECVVQFHPPQSVKVNRHEGCLHLWRPLGVVIPLPPMECV